MWTPPPSTIKQHTHKSRFQKRLHGRAGKFHPMVWNRRVDSFARAYPSLLKTEMLKGGRVNEADQFWL